MKRKILPEKPSHQKIIDEAPETQKKMLLARLKKGYMIVRVDGFEGIEVQRGFSWRCITKDGRDLSKSEF